MQPDFYQTVVENSPVAYAYQRIICDDNGLPVDYEILDLNPAMERITGLARAEIIGKTASEVLPALIRSPDNWISKLGDVALHEGRSDFAHYFHSFGRWFRYIAHSPRKYYFITYMIDVSAEIRLVEDRRSFMEKSPYAIFIFSPEGHIIEVNQALCDMSGYTREELLSMNIDQLLHPLDSTRGLDQLGAMDESDSASFETLILAAGGEERWWNTSIMKLLEEGFMCYGEDITHRKKAEAALQNKLRYEAAVAECMKTLMEEGELSLHLAALMEILQEASGVSRVYLFENETVDGELCMTQTFEACAPGIEPQLDNSQLQQLPFSIFSSELSEKLASGQPYFGIVSELPEPEREVLEPQGVQSILLLPVFKGSEFWGYAGFDDCESPRQWSADEISLLMVTSGAIGLAVQRQSDRQDLLESHERLTSIMNSIDAVIYIADMNTHELLFMNDSALQIRHGQVIGQPCWEILQGRDSPCPFCTNDRLVNPDGSLAGICKWEFFNEHDSRWYDLTDQAIHWIDGRIVRMEIAVDITERKKSEQEKENLRQLLNTIIDSMPSLLVAVDDQGHVTRWNQKAEEITGLSKIQAIGRNIGELMPRADDLEKHIQRAIAGQTVITRHRVRYYLQDRLHFLNVLIYPLAEGPFTGAVIRIDDASDQVRMEELMIQTEKMLSVGGLAAGMAHEINNPLGGIIQGAQNIERRLDPGLAKNIDTARQLGINLEQIRSYLEERQIMEFLAGIRDSGRRASHIVHNMLQFSQVRDFHHSTHQPRELLERSLELAASDFEMRQQMTFHSIEINREYEPGLVDIICSDSEIEQVLLNLVKNAVWAVGSVHSPGYQPRITLRCYRQEQMAVMEVEDNGVGMDELTRRRVFEPFFTTRPTGQGIGLGLTVAYFIVTRNHSGQLLVESSPGRGSRFSVKLPIDG